MWLFQICLIQLFIWGLKYLVSTVAIHCPDAVSAFQFRCRVHPVNLLPVGLLLIINCATVDRTSAEMAFALVRRFQVAGVSILCAYFQSVGSSFFIWHQSLPDF